MTLWSARSALLAAVAATLVASGAQGHGTETTGSILVPFTDSADTGLFSLARANLNTNGLNGVVSYNIAVNAGNSFLLEDTCCSADFDVTFTGGAYTNGPGDEGGTVPGTGHAVVTLFFGSPGSTFKFHEY
jgi:hypothetical protein